MKIIYIVFWFRLHISFRFCTIYAPWYFYVFLYSCIFILLLRNHKISFPVDLRIKIKVMGFCLCSTRVGFAFLKYRRDVIIIVFQWLEQNAEAYICQVKMLARSGECFVLVAQWFKVVRNSHLENDEIAPLLCDEVMLLVSKSELVQNCRL